MTRGDIERWAADLRELAQRLEAAEHDEELAEVALETTAAGDAMMSAVESSARLRQPSR